MLRKFNCSLLRQNIWLAWYDLQLVHLIFAEEPKCSGLVNRCRQSCKDRGGLLAAAAAAAAAALLLWFPFPFHPLAGKSREMSQNGSMVVDTLRHAWKRENCRR